MNVLDLRLLGRLGGAALFGGAACSLLFVVLPRWGTAGGMTALLLVVGAAAGGLASVRSQWQEPHRWAGLGLAAGAAAFLCGNALITGGGAVWGPFYVVVFVWAGLALGPGRGLPLIPFALVCYLLPSGLAQTHDLASALGVLAVAALTGEVLAYLAEQVRQDVERTRGRERDLQRLVSGQIELATTSDPQEAADASVRLAARLMHADEAALLLVRDGRREPVASWPPPVRTTSPAPTGVSLVRGEPGGLPGMSGRAAVEVPLKGRPGSGVRGVLAVRMPAGGRPDAFRAGLLRSLGAATTAALESLALAERLRLSAETDPLTGLGNRRRLGRVLARITPGDAVVLLDLDRFKSVNDTLGHAAGDDVLRDFGRFLTDLTRAGELAVRTGGEEFVLVTSGAGSAAGEPGTDALEALLDRLGRGWADRDPITSFSAGVAVYRGGDPAATLERADEALYAAKHRGRSAAWVCPAGRRVDEGTLVRLPGRPFDPAASGGLLDLTADDARRPSPSR